MKRFLPLCVLLLTIMNINSFYFSLEEGKQECFINAVWTHSITALDYHVLDKMQLDNGEKMKIKLEVHAMNSGKLIQEETLMGNKEGEVEIFYEGPQDYLQICFSTDSYHWFKENKKFRIEIDYHLITPQNKEDNDNFAKLEDLQPIYELNQDLDSGIHQIQQQVDSYQESNWRLMNDLETTNTNIAFIATYQVVLLIVLAVIQLVYLRRFISRKNL